MPQMSLRPLNCQGALPSRQSAGGRVLLVFRSIRQGRSDGARPRDAGFPTSSNPKDCKCPGTATVSGHDSAPPSPPLRLRVKTPTSVPSVSELRVLVLSGAQWAPAFKPPCGPDFV